MLIDYGAFCYCVYTRSPRDETTDDDKAKPSETESKLGANSAVAAARRGRGMVPGRRTEGEQGVSWG